MPPAMTRKVPICRRVLSCAFELSLAMGILLSQVLLFVLLCRDGINLDAVSILLTLLLVLIMMCLGYFVGALFIWPFAHAIALRMQGGPYEPGASVVVGRGKYAGMETEVYEVWSMRNQLRVVVPEAEGVEDVLSDVEVYRGV